MNAKNQFNDFGALYVKDVLSKEIISLLTHCLMRAPAYQQGRRGDEQVPNAAGIMEHEIIFETVQEKIWNAVENIIEEELIPTYSYARLYTNGNTLEKHYDRPSCEVSITVQLARTHHYSWPIYMGGKRFDIAEGDGVIYQGCAVEHWRNPCDGPEGYLSGQAFFHYVKKNGAHSDWATDKRWGPSEQAYIRQRHFILENK